LARQQISVSPVCLIPTASRPDLFEFEVAQFLDHSRAKSDRARFPGLGSLYP
jgi:hypothetical protein